MVTGAYARLQQQHAFVEVDVPPAHAISRHQAPRDEEVPFLPPIFDELSPLLEELRDHDAVELHGDVPMAELFSEALQGVDVTKFDVWKDIRSRLPDPKVFALDFDLENFLVSDGSFEGMADLMLTYRGDFLGPIDESVTLPAMLYGEVVNGSPIVRRIEVSFA